MLDKQHVSSDDDDFHAEQVAVELCWRTCISSRSNGEELARSGGVEVLGALLARCCAVLTPDAAPTAPAAMIAAHALRALAGMAALPSRPGRAAGQV